MMFFLLTTISSQSPEADQTQRAGLEHLESMLLALVTVYCLYRRPKSVKDEPTEKVICEADRS